MANRLSPAQQKVARVLVEAVAGAGFAMAGGSALNALGISDRLSEDIDAFSATCRDVRIPAARAADAFRSAGWDVSVDRDTSTFCRLVVTTARRRRTQVVVELGQDAIEWGIEQSSVGPVLTVRELAANKVLAAFGRIKPRDVCDLRVLAEHVPVPHMLRDAKTKDDAFDLAVLDEMVRRTLERPEREWPPGIDAAEERAWARAFLVDISGLDLSALADEPVGDPATSTPEGWVHSYRRRDGTVVGGYRHGGGPKR